MFRRKLQVLLVVVLALNSVLLGRLAFLQLARADYYRYRGRALQEKDISCEALRGRILDRNGDVLATSRPSYDICIVPNHFEAMEDEEREAWFSRVGRQLDVGEDGLRRRVDAIYDGIEREIARTRPDGRRYTRMVRKRSAHAVREDVPFSYAAYVATRGDVFPSVEYRSECFPTLEIRAVSRRHYPYGDLACHVIGYMSCLGPERYGRYKEGYGGEYRKRYTSPDDAIGHTGIEAGHNEELRGLRGERRVLVNAHNQTQEVIEAVPPAPGGDVRLTIDRRIQVRAEELLGSRKGSVVVLDVATGAILALANSPRYDLNTFRRADEYAALRQDKRAPFLNRAISAALPLGSIFKVVTLVAALEEGVADVDTCFECEGMYYYGSGNQQVVYRCWSKYGHGVLDMTEATERSCNVYFFNLGRLLGPRRLVTWAERFGFGRPSGIDLSGERVSAIPPPGWAARNGRNHLNIADTINLAVGQGPLLVTPLQTARMMAIAATGRLVVPHITVDARPSAPMSLGARPRTLQIVREALIEVIEGIHGTGRSTRSDVVRFAGKTGTAQTGRANPHGWFAGFAPYENPRIAFAVVIEDIPRDAHGGDTAGPVGKQIIEFIFANALVPARGS